MEQRIRTAEELFREPALKEPSPRRRLGLLPTRMAGIREFRYDPQQYQAIESALVEHARKMAETRERGE